MRKDDHLLGWDEVEAGDPVLVYFKNGIKTEDKPRYVGVICSVRNRIYCSCVEVSEHGATKILLPDKDKKEDRADKYNIHQYDYLFVKIPTSDE